MLGELARCQTAGGQPVICHALETFGDRVRRANLAVEMDFHLSAIMRRKNGREKRGDGVLAKIRRHIADTQTRSCASGRRRQPFDATGAQRGKARCVPALGNRILGASQERHELALEIGWLLGVEKAGIERVRDGDVVDRRHLPPRQAES